MRTIGVVTVSRSDYGIYLPILRRMREDRELTLRLIVGGMHLASEFGLTVREIETDGFEVTEQVQMRLDSDAPEAIAASMGLGTAGFARAYARLRPDLILVLGDRFEMHAATVAAVPLRIPIAHVHGGEITEGAIDDAFRHSITKLSHLHFVSTEQAAERVRQMGEEPWRVIVSGAPGLDTLHATPRLSREELAEQLRLPLDPAPLLITYHPVTLELEQTEWQVRELLEVLQGVDRPMVFTMSNADPGGRLIAAMLREFIEHQNQKRTRMVSNLGTQGYLSLMAVAAAMVGNSSSGLIEAPSLGLPVVNIGTRQDGRLRAENVIDVGNHREEIAEGIQRALVPAFRARLRGLPNPYGDGRAGDIIVRHLKAVSLDARLIRKKFVEVSAQLPDIAGQLR